MPTSWPTRLTGPRKRMEDVSVATVARRWEIMQSHGLATLATNSWPGSMPASCRRTCSREAPVRFPRTIHSIGPSDTLVCLQVQGPESTVASGGMDEPVLDHRFTASVEANVRVFGHPDLPSGSSVETECGRIERRCRQIDAIFCDIGSRIPRHPKGYCQTSLPSVGPGCVVAPLCPAFPPMDGQSAPAQGLTPSKWTARSLSGAAPSISSSSLNASA
jgi:hypothetical protein